MHAYTISLEAKLKEPIPTSCSTCEMHALKNLELAHYVDRLQDENDELRKLMGWLSGHEPQLRIMIETFKRQDGEGLGANKVGEGGRGSGGWAGEFAGGQFARRSPPRAQYGEGRIHSFENERRDSSQAFFPGFGPPPGREGWFPHGGYRGGVHRGSFGRKDGLVCANPTFEKMARHWFYSFGTNPSAESFVRSRARF
jgi:hypothetical protein